jgi:hypothetical protein
MKIYFKNPQYKRYRFFNEQLNYLMLWNFKIFLFPLYLQGTFAKLPVVLFGTVQKSVSGGRLPVGSLGLIFWK